MMRSMLNIKMEGLGLTPWGTQQLGRNGSRHSLLLYIVLAALRRRYELTVRVMFVAPALLASYLHGTAPNPL